jgi:hypothetical protein
MGYVIDNLHLEGVIEPAIKVRDVYVINAHEAKTVAAAKALLAGEAGPVDADEAGYLASLISAATRDPEWCEHVSADLVLPPNPAPFRDWCLFTLANDIKDTRVCDLMTPVAKEQKVIEAKAKGVRREIAEQLSLQHACKWQITNGTNLTYGPEVPTNPAQIQRLVARLGIAMPSAHDWSASEQAAYYGRFLWALWPHENDAVHRAARSKLVERLLALEGRL